MFFTAHYGDADSVLMNTNCKCKIVLERLKEKCGCHPEESVDLADMQAVVQKLSDYSENTYANEILQARGNYVLVKFIRRVDESGMLLKEYLPLLNGLDQVNPEFINRLSNRKINPDAYIRETKDNLKAMMRKKGGNESRLSNKPKPSNVSLSTGSPGQRKQSTRH